MLAPQPKESEPRKMSEKEYLAYEAKSETKHEFVAGKVFAMAGAGVNHNIINSNANAILNTQVFGKDCVVMSSDMRLKVDSKKVSYRYPDTMVICGEIKYSEDSPQTVVNPTLIIEVISPSTALTDHNEKLDEYIKIESLQEYILIASHEAKLERYLRQEGEGWLYTQAQGLEASLELPSIGCKLDLARLYDKVQFDEGESRTE